MAHFLRDQRITNLTITEEVIEQISTLFIILTNKFNSALEDITDKKAILSYIIRFDNKGYRVYTLDELRQYFRQAKEIEHILFTIETNESISSGRKFGAVMELGLNQKSNNGCFLFVTSDDKDWVDASFSAVQDILIKSTNKNGWARTAWVEFMIQIVGVAFSFYISLLAATKFSSKFSIANSFILCFFFVLFILSNAWSYLNKFILAFIYKYFPNLNFYRPDKDKVNWLVQTVFGGVICVIVIWFLGKIGLYFINGFSDFIAKSS